jgi:putative heme-binding domain-containing protein
MGRCFIPFRLLCHTTPHRPARAIEQAPPGSSLSMGTRGKRRGARLLVLAVSALVSGPVLPAFAQHETAADIEDGGRVFRDRCANCHGPDGDEIAGVDLGRGQFRRASSDQDLVRIIQDGIPGTPMPANNFSDEQTARVVAYLRSIAASKRSSSALGDPERGRALFGGRGSCATCHRVSGSGGRLGPDLSTIGQLRRAIEIERSLLEPDAEVLGPNRSYRVVTKDGTTITGRLLNLDTFTVQLLDSQEQLRSFVKADLREYGFVDKSPMPSYSGKLDAQELADVVSYLVSLKDRVTP